MEPSSTENTGSAAAATIPAESTSANPGQESQQQSSQTLVESADQGSDTTPAVATPGDSVADALAMFENIQKGGPQTPFATPSEATNKLQKAEQNGQTPQQLQQQNQPNKIPGLNSKRDYTGLTPEEAQLFSQMSTPAYNKFYKSHLASKKLQETLQQREQELEEARGQSAYDVDGAWRLRPEFNQLSNETQKFAGLANHWQEQLVNIRAGEKCTLVTGFDQQGNPVFSEPMDGNPRIEAAIINAMQQANAQYVNASSQLQSLEYNYKGQHQNYIKGLQQAERQIFAGIDEQRLNTAAQKKLELFPSYVRGKPEVKSLAKALVLIDGFRAMLADKASTQTTNGMQQKIAANAGPTAESIQSGGGAGETVGDALAEFNRLKASRY